MVKHRNIGMVANDTAVAIKRASIVRGRAVKNKAMVAIKVKALTIVVLATAIRFFWDVARNLKYIATVPINTRSHADWA